MCQALKAVHWPGDRDGAAENELQVKASVCVHSRWENPKEEGEVWEKYSIYWG